MDKTKKTAAAALLIVLLIASQVQALDLGLIGLIIKHVILELIKAVTEWCAKTVLLIMSPVIIFVQINPCVYPTGGGTTCDPYVVKLTQGTVTIEMEVDPTIRKINSAIMDMLQIIYLVAIIFLAIYLIFLSGSPQGRVSAKDMLARLLIGMILVSQSPIIFQFMLDIVRGIT
jgi:hypothetical protein